MTENLALPDPANPTTPITAAPANFEIVCTIPSVDGTADVARVLITSDAPADIIGTDTDEAFLIVDQGDGTGTVIDAAVDGITDANIIAASAGATPADGGDLEARAYSVFRNTSGVLDGDNDVVSAGFNADPIDVRSDAPPANDENTTTAGQKFVVVQQADGTEPTTATVVVDGGNNLPPLENFLSIDAAGAPFSPEPTEILSGTGNLNALGGGDTQLGDGAGNSYGNATVTLEAPTAPALADVTFPVVGTVGAADPLYDVEAGDPASTGPITVRLIFDAILSATDDAEIDVGTLPPGASLTVGASAIVDAIGQRDAVEVTLAPTAGAPNEVFFFDSDGQLLVTTRATGTLTQGEIDAAVPVTLELGAGAVTSLIGGQDNAALTTPSVVAGSIPTAQLLTADLDVDGELDGVLFAHNTPVTLGDGGSAAYRARVNLATSGGAGAVCSVDVGTDAADQTAENGEVEITDVAAAATPGAAGIDVAGSTISAALNTATANWDCDGEAGTADDQAAFAEFDTGSVNIVDVFVDEETSATTYDVVADPDTGENVVFSLPGFAAVGQDGARPIGTAASQGLVEDTDPTGGIATIDVSEDVVLPGAFDIGQFFSDAAPLDLIALNDGFAPADIADGGDVTLEDASGDEPARVIIGDVGLLPDIIDSALTVGSATGIEDAAGNPLAIAADVTVEEGDPEFVGPVLDEAVAARLGDDPEANVGSVVLFFDKGVALPEDVSELADGTFSLTGTVDGQPIDVDIPGSNVDLAQADEGTVILEIPDPGFVGSLTALDVDYAPSGEDKLVSTDDDPQDVTAFNENASLSEGSTKLFTQTVAVDLENDGSVVPDGTLVKASLVGTTDERSKSSQALVTVPCTCEAGHRDR